MSVIIVNIVALSMSILIIGCSSDVISRESMFQLLGEKYYASPDIASDCNVAAPKFKGIVDADPGGATVLFDWAPKQGDCIDKSWTILTLYRINTVVSRSMSNAEHFRGQVYRNLVPNSRYMLEGVTYRNGSLSSKFIHSFQVKSGLSIGEVNKEETKKNCEGKVTAPTNGKVSKLTTSTAQVSFDWKQKSGDCKPQFIATLWVRKDKVGSILEGAGIGNPAHIRGQLFVGLASNTEYLVENFAGVNTTTSVQLHTTFKTKGAV